LSAYQSATNYPNPSNYTYEEYWIGGADAPPIILTVL
jgi:hypothetical protein